MFYFDLNLFWWRQFYSVHFKADYNWSWQMLYVSVLIQPVLSLFVDTDCLFLGQPLHNKAI